MLLKIFTVVFILASIKAGTFTNPIVDFGPDPWVIQHEGFYYFCFSNGSIVVNKAKKLQDIGRGESKVVFVPPADGPYSKEVWAPELHYLQGKWYIYFAADDGNNDNHRMYVLESSQPQGPYIFKGKIAAHPDKWAIDGTVLDMGKELYFVWSGWEGDVNVRQDLYIAKMSNPWTIVGNRVSISIPTEPWEMKSQPHIKGGINEGPEAFIRKNKIYIIYSASASWSDDYCLGWIECDSAARVMDPKCWKKRGPVFKQAPEAYGPGHASFTKSPDGKQDWIVYHACLKSGGGWAGRSARIQQFMLVNGDTPVFGTPVKCHVPLPEPSGSE